jgi:hypothetical protein
VPNIKRDTLQNAILHFRFFRYVDEQAFGYNNRKVLTGKDADALPS